MSPVRPAAWVTAALIVVATIGGVRPQPGPAPDATEILWDRWGVPHIFARTATELFHAFGWAQMHSHGDLILELYGEARGRAAEYWGEDHLESDRFIHTMGVPERAGAWYAAQREAMRSSLDAFAAGMNAYARAHPERIDDAMRIVLPVTPEDALAHIQRVLHLTFIGGRANPGAAQWSDEPLGSNAWAVAPSRSASGHALLLANPHLPWNGFYTLYEAQLTAPGVNAYGATLVGTPILAIAFNDHLGWTHTNNTYDGMDLYELELSGDGYRWDGGVRPFETHTTPLKVKQDDGSLRAEALVVRRSVHGPVLAERDGRAVAVRIAGLDQAGLVEQYWDMIRATNLDQFETALARLQNPYFNVIYADRDGRIMYLFGGRTPRRPSGSWEDWQQVVPGTSSANLWTDTHPYGDLPRVVDPPHGWVQNANDPPWTSTFPMLLDPDDFPAYMAPRHMGFRPQRSVAMLAGDARITFEELIDYKLSTRMELADRLLDDLLAAVRDRGGELSVEAARVLDAWDREADRDSRGAVLFQAWARELFPSLRPPTPEVFATPWREAAPLTTPDGLMDPDEALAALERAARHVRDTYGALDVPWGDVYRLTMDGRDLPANGGPGELGIFRTIWYAEMADRRFRATMGDSYVAAVEFSDPVRARAVLSYGNASQPGSRHRGDQLELVASKTLRPVWRTRAQVEAHLERREPLSRP